ncbi:MAG TPA: substrate-binding domain-containing protein, partial [Chthoniobacteraceae bacterium]
MPVDLCRNPVAACGPIFMPAKPSNRTRKASPEPAVPHVALLVETSLASGREILLGVARYVRERGPWSLFHAPRGLEDSAPAWLARWQGHGIIARVMSPELARLLQKTGLPVVDVLGMAPRADFPLVHVDDAAISGLAFSHFAERGLRRFAFFGIAGENWSERRRDAFLFRARVFDAHAAVLEIPRHELEDTPWERRQDRLAAWLRELPKPVGLMICSDQRGPDVLEACRRTGIHVPD